MKLIHVILFYLTLLKYSFHRVILSLWSWLNVKWVKPSLNTHFISFLLYYFIHLISSSSSSSCCCCSFHYYFDFFCFDHLFLFLFFVLLFYSFLLLILYHHHHLHHHLFLSFFRRFISFEPSLTLLSFLLETSSCSFIPFMIPILNAINNMILRWS